MDARKKSLSFGVAVGAVGVIVLAAVIGLTIVYAGAYNVAATEEHASLARWALDTTFHNSVRRRAADLTAPAEFAEAEIAVGAHEYQAMCEHCHAGPGVEAEKWTGGMRPQPPQLTEAAANWKMTEVFWLAKHGARMTGMPAFGPTHDDRTLWNIAAFVKRLPAMTPERYATLGRSDDEQSHGDHAH